jgi:choline dehydrogenase-like flavoprotein
MSDVIIVGGGIAGVTLASRLHQHQPHLSILLIEAGPDVTNHPHISTPAEATLLHFSELDYNYLTIPQKNLDNLPRYNCGIKGLSGGSIINTGGWIRGDKKDYDEWARVVGDDRWSYDGMLPYFKRTERHFDKNADPHQHGFDGPITTVSVSASGRKYPLRDAVSKLWSSLGLKHISDANSGQPQGFADLVESWKDGKRQIASSVYSLDGVTVLTNSAVCRVLLDAEGVAVGVELVDGKKHLVVTGGQVVVSGGAYRTPQILMLSGIGDRVQLAEHGIHALVDQPQIGQNLHDHLLLYRYWKLRHPEEGLALSSATFRGDYFDKGGPIDYLATMSVPTAPLKGAIEQDQGAIEDIHPLLQNRSHLEMGILYAAIGSQVQGLDIPLDGTSIMSFQMAGLPTSRGSVKLASSDPNAKPVIDPNYFATETDKHIFREGFRAQSRLFLDSAEGREVVIEEHTPPGLPVLKSNATDKQIDERIGLGGSTCFRKLHKVKY